MVINPYKCTFGLEFSNIKHELPLLSRNLLTELPVRQYVNDHSEETEVTLAYVAPDTS